MNLQPSPITPDQWKKVLKALAYSFSSGFAGGLLLSLTNFLQSGQPIDVKVAHAIVIAAVVGGINTAAVTIKQLFSQN